MDDLLVYTLRVRAPSAWDGLKAEGAAESLNNALESAVDAVKLYAQANYPEMEITLEQ